MWTSLRTQRRISSSALVWASASAVNTSPSQFKCAPGSLKLGPVKRLQHETVNPSPRRPCPVFARLPARPRGLMRGGWLAPLWSHQSSDKRLLWDANAAAEGTAAWFAFFLGARRPSQSRTGVCGQRTGVLSLPVPVRPVHVSRWFERITVLPQTCTRSAQQTDYSVYDRRSKVTASTNTGNAKIEDER